MNETATIREIMQWADLGEAARDLAAQVLADGYRPEVIMGIARGGLLPAGAVALTGHPAALASALMKVSDGMIVLPTRDLRVAAARDAFHLLPVSEEDGRGVRAALTATHPSLRARIARLERMEAHLHASPPAR